jgi:hypothetical protein
MKGEVGIRLRTSTDIVDDKVGRSTLDFTWLSSSITRFKSSRALDCSSSLFALKLSGLFLNQSKKVLLECWKCGCGYGGRMLAVAAAWHWEVDSRCKVGVKIKGRTEPLGAFLLIPDPLSHHVKKVELLPVAAMLARGKRARPSRGLWKYNRVRQWVGGKG